MESWPLPFLIIEFISILKMLGVLLCLYIKMSNSDSGITSLGKRNYWKLARKVVGIVVRNRHHRSVLDAKRLCFVINGVKHWDGNITKPGVSRTLALVSSHILLKSVMRSISHSHHYSLKSQALVFENWIDLLELELA
jgi:hypothetical protein